MRSDTFHLLSAAAAGLALVAAGISLPSFAFAFLLMLVAVIVAISAGSAMRESPEDTPSARLAASRSPSTPPVSNLRPEIASSSSK